MLKLVKKSLAKYIEEAISSYKKSGEVMHVAIMSALHNFATSGNPVLINRIFDNLRTNDQQALRLYIRRASIVNGLVMTDGPQEIDTLDTKSMQEMVKVGAILDFRKGAFVCIQGPNSDAAKSFKKLIETRFLNPDGKRDKYVFERNNFAEHKTLGDAEVIKQLLKVTNDALNNSSENKSYALSEAIKTRLQKIRDMLDVNANQATLNEG